MNKATTLLIGNLAKDCTYTPGTPANGATKEVQARVTFVVVVNHHWMEKNDPKNHTNYPCTLWGKRATSLAQYLKQGKQVCVEGLPVLYAAGHLAENPEKSVRGFNLKVDKIDLGNDSLKAQAAAGRGSTMDPVFAAVVQEMAAKTGVDIEAIKARLATPPSTDAQGPF